jgi:hypothetical protein
VRVRDVRVPPDGRVTAYFDFRNLEGTFITYSTLVRQGERYLVDSSVEVAVELATPAA